MVGNGLRVATGAAFASGGHLVVESRGARQVLSFEKQTGETIIVSRTRVPTVPGTKITVQFGPALPRDSMATSWGDLAIRLAGQSATPMLTHADWYSESEFRRVDRGGPGHGAGPSSRRLAGRAARGRQFGFNPGVQILFRVERPIAEE